MEKDLRKLVTSLRHRHTVSEKMLVTHTFKGLKRKSEKILISSFKGGEILKLHYLLY